MRFVYIPMPTGGVWVRAEAVDIVQEDQKGAQPVPSALSRVHMLPVNGRSEQTFYSTDTAEAIAKRLETAAAFAAPKMP